MFRLLKRLFRIPEPAIRDAQERRQEALRHLRQAIAHNAKRDIGERFRPAFEATNAELRLSVRR